MGYRAMMVTCMDGRTGPISLGVDRCPELLCLRAPGGIVPVMELRRKMRVFNARLVILTWHYSIDGSADGCAAHGGCANTAKQKTHALAEELQRSGVKVVCARVNTNNGQLYFEPLGRVEHIDDEQGTIDAVRACNTRAVQRAEAKGGLCSVHTERFVTYGEAHLVRLDHGEAFALNTWGTPSLEARALSVAYGILASLRNDTPELQVTVPVNGSQTRAIAAAEKLADALTPHLTETWNVRFLGITQGGERVVLS